MRAPDLGEEAPDVAGHRRYGAAGEHPLEVLAGEVVLLLEEEGAGELQPHADQLGVVDEDGAEGRDRLVEQGVALVRVLLPAVGGAERRHAGEEEDVDLVRVVGIEGAEDAEGVIELAHVDQRPRILDCRVGGEMGVGERCGGDAEEESKDQRADHVQHTRGPERHGE